jgi:hypothetical protein
MTIYDDLLVSDFTQCFEQMRHHEESFLKRLDFGFGGIVVVIGGCAFLIEHFHATPFILSLSALLLSISSGAGAILVFSLARNRVYFAFVARYVNEIRNLYLSQHAGGLENHSGMYSDCRYPKIFSPGSTQTIDIYFLALSISILLGGAVTCANASHRLTAGIGPAVDWTAAVLTFVGAFVGQVLLVIAYWYSAERQSDADGAVHGERRPHTKVQKTDK